MNIASVTLVVSRMGVGLFCTECDVPIMRVKAEDSIDLRDLVSNIEQLPHECEPGVLVTAP